MKTSLLELNGSSETKEDERKTEVLSSGIKKDLLHWDMDRKKVILSFIKMDAKSAFLYGFITGRGFMSIIPPGFVDLIINQKSIDRYRHPWLRDFEELMQKEFKMIQWVNLLLFRTLYYPIEVMKVLGKLKKVSVDVNFIDHDWSLPKFPNDAVENKDHMGKINFVLGCQYLEARLVLGSARNKLIMAILIKK
ncbi:hypothetical protein Tco_1243336 [Tanacetum coccineum]